MGSDCISSWSLLTFLLCTPLIRINYAGSSFEQCRSGFTLKSAISLCQFTLSQQPCFSYTEQKLKVYM